MGLGGRIVPQSGWAREQTRELHRLSFLEQGLFAEGWKGALNKGIQYGGHSGMRAIGPLMIADRYAGLGEKDEVFRWLNAAYFYSNSCRLFSHSSTMEACS